jgi:hypothetical protein
MRCSEPGHRALVAIHASRGPDLPPLRDWVIRQLRQVMGQLLPSFLILACFVLAVLAIVWGSRRYRWMQSHWIAFTFLLPFLILLWVHHVLDLSDALMVATPPGEREAHIFNFVIVLVFYAGIAAFMAHTFCLPDQSRRWLAAKLAVLVGYWSGILYFGT